MRILRILCVVLVVLFCGVWSFADEISDVQLHECTDDTLNIQFLCNPNWPLISDADVMMMILNEKPLVTMTIVVSDSPVLSLKQLTNDIIQELGGYTDGFTTQFVQIAGTDAIQVAGGHQAHESVGLVDYYLIHDVSLYSILFSVDPKDFWLDYQELLFKIRDSLKWGEDDEHD